LEAVGVRDGESEWLSAKNPVRPRAAQPIVPRRAPGVMTKLKRLVRARSYTKLFDPEYYRASYPDVTGNPLVHFIVAGAFEGRNPHPLFDTNFYLRKYPDVAQANLNPLGHYLKYGAAEGRQPHPLFDPAYYLDHYPDVRESGMNPLLHYVLHGAQEHRRPHLWFVPDYYLMRCPDARSRGGDPLVHFLQSEPSNCCSPHPLFDCEAYLQAYPDVAMNPLVHWLRTERTQTQEIVPALKLDIDDVNLVIAFEEPEFSADAVRFWKDPRGRTRFVAPPQQRPFFEPLSYDQLRAQ
jgi:hypothetical protein